MSISTLNINNSAVVKHTAKLEKMHRSALPVAIRGAINNAAFDVKQRSMPKSSKKSFTIRKQNFFKANSRVLMAKGFHVRSMRATVGFLSSGLKGNNNQAVKDLEEQEHGGSIGGRSFIPLKTSRVSTSDSRPVKAWYRLNELKNVVNANKVVAPSKKQKFIKAAFKAKQQFGKDAFVLGNVRSGGRLTLSHIKTIRSSGRNGIKMTRVPIYSYKKGFVARVKPTQFMRRATMESGLKIEQYFLNQARKQFERLNK